jgi:hypothetical protein
MDELTYGDLDKNREIFLNLKSPDVFASFFAGLEKE